MRPAATAGPACLPSGPFCRGWAPASEKSGILSVAVLEGSCVLPASPSPSPSGSFLGVPPGALLQPDCAHPILCVTNSHRCRHSFP